MTTLRDFKCPNCRKSTDPRDPFCEECGLNLSFVPDETKRLIARFKSGKLQYKKEIKENKRLTFNEEAEQKITKHYKNATSFKCKEFALLKSTTHSYGLLREMYPELPEKRQSGYYIYIHRGIQTYIKVRDIVKWIRTLKADDYRMVTNAFELI